MEQEQYISILSLESVDSSFCGVYTCIANDSGINEPSNMTSSVDVGKCITLTCLEYACEQA